MPWWVKLLFDIFAGMKTKQDLANAGASPADLSGALTTSLDLPTFGNGPEAEEDLARARIVSFMRSQIGKKYVFGIEIPEGADADGWDCSEISSHAYARCGFNFSEPLRDGAQAQFNQTQPVNNAKAGDLLFLWSDKRGMIGHVMVASGEGTVIHAVGGRGVVEDPIHRWTSDARYRGTRRHIDFIRGKDERATA